jgi:hypothetical protein
LSGGMALPADGAHSREIHIVRIAQCVRFASKAVELMRRHKITICAANDILHCKK